MGALYCILSAAAFGAMAFFGKLAFGAGVSLDALLLIRFGMAALVLLIVATARGTWWRFSLRGLVIGLLMGAVGYAAQAGFYFAALRRLDASMVALILYVYPVLVMAAAVMMGRERISRHRIVALTVALFGIILVLAGTATGTVDPLGAMLALGAGLTYTGYILIGDAITKDLPALGLSAIVCVGAFGTFAVMSVARGGVDVSFGASGWLWLSALSLISTVGAILFFFAGLSRVGPSTAAILSIVEPMVTVLGAAALFGEALTPVQWCGGALVLLAVLLVQQEASRQSAPKPASRALMIAAARSET